MHAGEGSAPPLTEFPPAATASAFSFHAAHLSCATPSFLITFSFDLLCLGALINRRPPTPPAAAASPDPLRTQFWSLCFPSFQLQSTRLDDFISRFNCCSEICQLQSASARALKSKGIEMRKDEDYAYAEVRVTRSDRSCSRSSSRRKEYKEKEKMRSGLQARVATRPK